MELTQLIECILVFGTLGCIFIAFKVNDKRMLKSLSSVPFKSTARIEPYREAVLSVDSTFLSAKFDSRGRMSYENTTFVVKAILD